MAHHLQSPLLNHLFYAKPSFFVRFSHDGNPFESQWVEVQKRERVLCMHLSSVPSIALARYLLALCYVGNEVRQTSWNLCHWLNWAKNMKMTVDFKWDLNGPCGGVLCYSVTLVIEPRLSNVCCADVTVLASVDLRNIISAHSSTRKEKDVTWTRNICHTLKFWSATSKSSNIFLINLPISMVAWPNAPVKSSPSSQLGKTHTGIWSQHPACRASHLSGVNICWIYRIYMNLMRMEFICTDGKAQSWIHLKCYWTIYSSTVKAPALEDKQNRVQQ